MSNIASLARLASLVGEPARAAMMMAMMDGRALTAGELAGAAGVAPSTASGHLGQLLDSGLIALERQGRHRYYRLAGPAVAAMLEGMMSLSGALGTVNEPPAPVRTGPRDLALRRARLCYDHLAGEVAVAIADAMGNRDQLDFGVDGGALTEQGHAFLLSLDVTLGDCPPQRRRGATFCRPCLDWSERRPHIAGIVGRALYQSFIRKGWMRVPASGRAVSISPRGLAGLERHFGLRPG